MMHIVYSAFSQTADQNQTSANTQNQQPDTDLALRLIAHRQVCEKYQDEIKAIRKYLPQWQPKFSGE